MEPFTHQSKLAERCLHHSEHRKASKRLADQTRQGYSFMISLLMQATVRLPGEQNFPQKNVIRVSALFNKHKCLSVYSKLVHSHQSV